LRAMDDERPMGLVVHYLAWPGIRY
jgi:hypothetical protein